MDDEDGMELTVEIPADDIEDKLRPEWYRLPDEVADAAKHAADIRGYESSEAFVAAAVRDAIRQPFYDHAGVYDDDAAAIATLEELVAELDSPLHALDYWAIECVGYSQMEWARIRDITSKGASQNRLKAADALGVREDAIRHPDAESLDERS